MSSPAGKWSGRISLEKERGVKRDTTRFGEKFNSPEPLPRRSTVTAHPNTGYKNRPSDALGIIAMILDLLSLW
jgi:hypothetical protein